MRWDQFDIDRRTVTFYRPKNRDWHVVPLHPDLIRFLEDRALADDTWVFPGRYGGHVSPAQVWSLVKLVGERAGVALTPHVLRHVALTTANDATRDLRAVQEFAGHRSPVTTARYTRVGEQRLAEAVASLSYDRTAAEGAQ